jgi:hypothetical protein
VNFALTEPDIEVTVNEVSELLDIAKSKRARADRTHRRRFARLLKDPKAIDLTIRLTDDSDRSQKARLLG